MEEEEEEEEDFLNEPLVVAGELGSPHWPHLCSYVLYSADNETRI